MDCTPEGGTLSDLAGGLSYKGDIEGPGEREVLQSRRRHRVMVCKLWKRVFTAGANPQSNREMPDRR